MPTAAIYARYSTDEQRPTSIDDQVRQCRQNAATQGFTVDEKWVFSDSAITGTAKGRVKRVAYQRLLDAIADRLIDVVFVDEVSRVARDMLEGAKMMDIVERTGLRIVTGDGIDSLQKNWKLMWSFKLMSAVQEVESTADRVGRGMIGQLERGYQIAQPPFGYTGTRIKAADGRELGTLWELDPVKAGLMRDMYRWRFEGQSVSGIAKRLNLAGILPPSHTRCKGTPYWRPATVHRVLANTIYKGVFVWNGSAFTRAKARAKRKVIETISYGRPALRLVSDEIWAACNPSAGKETVRGGGRHALSGTVTCGVCDAKLSITGGPKSFAVNCPQCEQALRVQGHSKFIGYSSLSATKQALNWGLQQLFTGAVHAEFHARLQARLLSGPEKEATELRARLSELEVSLQRLQRLALDPSIGEELLRVQMAELAGERRSKQGRLEVLKKRASHVTQATVALQASMDPLPLIERLLEGEPQAYKVRATLRRLIKRFALVGRKDKRTSIFELEFTPGVCIAELSDSDVIDESPVAFRVTVSCTAKRPVVWQIEGQRI
jgi:site-specific DNA recombinase